MEALVFQTVNKHKLFLIVLKQLLQVLFLFVLLHRMLQTLNNFLLPLVQKLMNCLENKNRVLLKKNSISCTLRA